MEKSKLYEDTDTLSDISIPEDNNDELSKLTKEEKKNKSSVHIVHIHLSIQRLSKKAITVLCRIDF